MKMCVECGQRWYRLSSWYSRYPNKTYYPKFRNLSGHGRVGWAFGPIMFFLKGYTK